MWQRWPIFENPTLPLFGKKFVLIRLLSFIISFLLSNPTDISSGKKAVRQFKNQNSKRKSIESKIKRIFCS